MKSTSSDRPAAFDEADAIALALFPTPREFRLTGGAFALPAAPPLFCAPTDIAAARAFFAAAGVEAQLAPLPADAVRFTIATAADASLDAAGLPAGGYALRCTVEGLVARGVDAAGFVTALQSLRQWLGRPVPCCELRDWPAVKTRAFQIDLGRQPETLAELKRLVRQQSLYHFNECQLYLENSIKLAAFGAAADPRGLTPQEFRELQEFARDLGMDVVPSLNLLGHLEKILRHPDFEALSEMKHGARHPAQSYGGCICPELPESKALMRAVIAEISALSLSPKLVVGLDECWTLGSHPLSRPRLDENGGAGAMFREWITFLHEECTRGGKRMWMWEDMLFYHHGALGRIPSDIGMSCWHYQHIESVPMYSFQNWRRIDAMEILGAQGHPIMLCCGPDLHHLHSMMRYAVGQTLDGVLVVQWGGIGVVQEYFHIGRALSAGLLWSGVVPSLAAAARVLGHVDEPTAAALGDLLAHWTNTPVTKSGGSHRCPRFWSWPENAAALLPLRALANAWRRHAHRDAAFEVPGLFIEQSRLDLVADWARETVALAGRKMLQHGRAADPIVDDAIAQLASAVDAAEGLPAQAREIHDRYTRGLAERPMPKGFASDVASCHELLARLRAFQVAPSAATWPFAAVSLHVDGLTLDACAHNVSVQVDAGDGTWTSVYKGAARLPPTLEGEFVMSFPVERAPRRVRLAVGGFASLGILRVRIETLAGTHLPARLLESHGFCRDPQHLLEFDRKMAVFNPPDVMSNWLSLTPPEENYVVMEWDW